MYHVMWYMFKFYLQIFTAVRCGLLVSRGRGPNCKRFRPKSYESCPHLRLQPLLLSVPVVIPNLLEEGGTWSLTYPHTEKSRGIKSGDRGGQAVVRPRPIQASICRVTQGNHNEHL